MVMEEHPTGRLTYMAFDLYGITDSIDNGFVLRFNIWKWNDVRLVLQGCGFFQKADQSKFMTNDGYLVSGEVFNIFYKNVDIFLEKCKSNPSAIRNILYSEEIICHRKYALPVEAYNTEDLDMNDLMLIKMLCDKSDSFSIR